MKKKRTPSSQRWLKEHHSDLYVKQARKEGYRSRAVYKLLEIQEKEKLIQPGMTVIDVGAAPGSWSEVAIKWVGKKGKLIAVDLLPITPIPHVTFIQGDFEEENTWQAIQTANQDRPIDVILSDMAPNTCGIQSADQLRSVSLAESVLDFAQMHLSAGGTVLIKVFQGEGFDALLKTMRTQFKTVKIKKPAASRARSKEVYLLGVNIRSPSCEFLSP
jgi:23S rRNA (uridine2552-2'-O)-methyltransferase